MRDDVVHRRVYTDPALFDIEMDRIFGGTWCYIGHESEVPQPGSFVRNRLGRRQILLVRTAGRRDPRPPQPLHPSRHDAGRRRARLRQSA